MELNFSIDVRETDTPAADLEVARAEPALVTEQALAAEKELAGEEG